MRGRGEAREREREKGLQSRCHQDTGPQAPISCHLSSAQTSSPHFLFGLHNVTKEGGGGKSTLAWMQPKSGVRVCVNGGTGTFGAEMCEAAARRRFVLYIVPESGFRQTGPGRFSVFKIQLDIPLSLQAPVHPTHAHPRPAPVPFTFPPKNNSKGKRNRSSGIFPFVPDYTINLTPALKPIITYCLLSLTSAVSLPLFNSIAGFYSKTSFSKGKKRPQMVTYHLHGNKWKERSRGRKH